MQKLKVFIHKKGYLLIFLLLWLYLIIRGITVFYIHDEIVTKWAYMIDWNYLPYTGFLDANNHFVNSFFGGLFYRIFNTDAPIIYRLGNLLAFPLAFWSLFGLKKYFRNQLNFLALLTAIFCSAFIIEYFSMARGYGLSIAFLLSCIHQAIHFFDGKKYTNLLLSILSAILAVYSNMSLLPLALIVLFSLGLYMLYYKNYKAILFPVIALIPLIYAAQYAFHLKENGRLYYGGNDGFFLDTVKSLTEYLWNLYHPALNAMLVIASVFILLTVIINIRKDKKYFSALNFVGLFFILSIVNIIVQHYILDVLWPLDRAVIYLPILFFIALFLSIDQFKIKTPAILIGTITLVLFVFDINFSHSKFFYYEHFDEELISKIPETTNGITTSTGGRFWVMDNEIMRNKNLKTFAFQNSPNKRDTLQDYIVSTLKIRPELKNLYHTIHQDDISKLTLFERNSFLKRKILFSKKVDINNDAEYLMIHEDNYENNLLLRVKGNIKNFALNKEFPLIITTENQETLEKDMYQGFSILQSSSINKDGCIDLDLSFVIHKSNIANKYKMYIYNKGQQKLIGDLIFETYILSN